MTETMTVPVPFEGTDDQKRINFGTHSWMVVDPQEARVCGTCDIKSWHVAALWPCLTGGGRMTIEVSDDPEERARQQHPGLFGQPTEPLRIIEGGGESADEEAASRARHPAGKGNDIG